jgi:hypothetical protein
MDQQPGSGHMENSLSSVVIYQHTSLAPSCAAGRRPNRQCRRAGTMRCGARCWRAEFGGRTRFTWQRPRAYLGAGCAYVSAVRTFARHRSARLSICWTYL